MRFGGIGSAIDLTGVWSPTLATVLLLVSLLCGIVIYRLGNIKALKEGEIFVGGEPIEDEEVRIPGTHFYDTIQSTGFLRFMYDRAKAKTFDLYVWGRRGVMALAVVLYRGVDRPIDIFYDRIRLVSLELSQIMRKVHTGIITHYVLWIFVGITVLLLLLMKS